METDVLLLRVLYLLQQAANTSGLDWLEIFRDPVWGFIGVIVGVLALVIGIDKLFRAKERKSLVALLIEKVPFTNAHKLPSSFLVTLNGRTLHVPALQVIRIQFINTGNWPIVAGDF